ncbi:MAG: ferrous iron transport protein A [Candidatus Altiarchaeota archaeon]|nr:ferrous iron transport protein A [Candidatus Altiarchaeota archaeon]
MEFLLLDLEPSQYAKIKDLGGGHVFQDRMRSMGLKEGSSVKLIAKEPFGGPIVVKVGNTRVTLGRGMASKILVEKQTA